MCTFPNTFLYPYLLERSSYNIFPFFLNMNTCGLFKYTCICATKFLPPLSFIISIKLLEVFIIPVVGKLVHACVKQSPVYFMDQYTQCLADTELVLLWYTPQWILPWPSSTCYICNMGRNDLPDIYVYKSMSAHSAWGWVQTYQANHDCTCYIWYVTLQAC